MKLDFDIGKVVVVEFGIGRDDGDERRFVAVPVDGNPFTGKTRHAVITRRVSLTPGERMIAYRLSDTVYLEE